MGSHAEWMERQLLDDMEPKDKWKVEVAHAPKIPRRSTPEEEQEMAVTSTSTTPDGSACSSNSGEERSTTGESGEIFDVLLEKFEPSSRVEGEARGWGETFSHQAVEELNQWLLSSGDHPAKPPPPYDGKSRTQNLTLEPRGVESTPKSRPKGVETNQGSSHRGVPQHVRDQRESEEKFKLLPIVAVEPSQERDME